MNPLWFLLNGQPFYNGGNLPKSLDTNTTSASNVSTSETDLITYTLGGETLRNNGNKIRVTAWGTGAANANSKTIRIRFGATIVATRATTSNNFAWIAQATIVRTGAAAQVAFSEIYEAGNGGAPTTSSPTETLSSPIVVKVTGQSATAGGDVTALGMTVEFLP